MSGPRERPLPVHPHQDRDSHINFRLIDHGLDHQIQESGRSQADQLEEIAERTVPPVKSTQPRGMLLKKGAINESGRDQAVQKPAPPRIGLVSSRIQHDSPWKTYEKGYDLKFDQFVIVAVRKAPYHGKVVIKAFAKKDATHKLDMIQRVNHERFVQHLEVFEFDDAIYAVFEHIFTSLKQVVGSAAYPNERQLIAILAQVGLYSETELHVAANEGQILEGLSYLSSVGLQHGSLTCSSVLLKADGEIKITNQECCQLADKLYGTDVKAVGYIAMELMQKYAKEDGLIGIDNLNRWPVDSDAVKFLSTTTSAASIEELKKVSKLAPGKQWLTGPARIT